MEDASPDTNATPADNHQVGASGPWSVIPSQSQPQLQPEQSTSLERSTNAPDARILQDNSGPQTSKRVRSHSEFQQDNLGSQLEPDPKRQRENPAMASGKDDPASGAKPQNSFCCIFCNEGFTRKGSVVKHVVQCVRNRGNPSGRD